MRKTQIYFALLIIFSGCSNSRAVTSPSLDFGTLTCESSSQFPGYIPWGFYDLEIARDGSYADVVPNRSANGTSNMWGNHLNVVKLLEIDPCTDCLQLSNIHLLPNGDVSIDISLRHPYTDPRWTGFDVRGIIMFPATQYIPDNNIREQMGLAPCESWKLRVANHDYGDAQLMNPDGWTNAWSSEEGPGPWDYNWYNRFAPDTQMPIFRYYPGKFASGDNLSTFSAYKRFHSTDVRHMFEVGHTVMQTYIIRPPASGPIFASYAVYAHWFPATNVPVIDPATDFPPEANSPLPYEFYITQDAPLDPDAPGEVNIERVHWHIKTWSIGSDLWVNTVTDLGFFGTSGQGISQHPSGEPDDYQVDADYTHAYVIYSGGTAGSWSMFCNLGVYNPKDSNPGVPIGCETYLAHFEYAALDGEW
jgi:hypothetical protein